MARMIIFRLFLIHIDAHAEEADTGPTHSVLMQGGA